MSAPAADTVPGGAPAPAAAPPNTFGDIMAKIRAKAVKEPPREPTTVSPAPVPQVPAKVEIPGDDVALKRVTRLEAENLAQKTRITELEGAEKDAKLLRDVKKLYSDGKKMDAIAMLAGADPTGEMEELLSAYLASDDGTPAAATAEAALAAKVDEALDAGKKAQEAVDKLKADDAARARATEDRARLSFALAALDGAKNDDGSPRFELCGRPENRGDLEKLLFGFVDDKGVEQMGHVQRMAVKQQVKNEDVTPDLARKLILDAYADIEAELEAEGVEQQKLIDARYRKTPAAAPAPRAAEPQTPQRVSPPEQGAAPGRQGEPQARPMQRPPVRTDAPKPAHSLDAVMAKNRERARY